MKLMRVRLIPFLNGLLRSRRLTLGLCVLFIACESVAGLSPRSRAQQQDNSTKEHLEATTDLTITGTAVPELSAFDDEMSQLMAEHQIPGASIAVTDQGRLIFARGYGVADLQTGEPVLPTSLFRIASVSKPITAIAIMQLVEQQKLSLDTKVYSLLKLLPDVDSDSNADADSNTKPFDDRKRQITIQQLLQHRAGFDRDASFDPMFRSAQFAKQLDIQAPAMPWDIIRAMQSQPLDFAPGERYSYSNFGYCLLGRVIEEVSGMSYEAYVKQFVLAPIGIVDMRIGGTLERDRVDGEVRYYAPGKAKSVFQQNLGDEVPWPYGGWCLEAMDAHGGWIASAVDLAKLAAAFDDPSHCKLLSKESVSLMHRRPALGSDQPEDKTPEPVYYSLGWQNRVLADGKMNHWHNGSLDGTTAMLIRRHDRRNFVVLLNTRASKTAQTLAHEADALPHRAAAKVKSWPAIDQFSDFGR